MPSVSSWKRKGSENLPSDARNVSFSLVSVGNSSGLAVPLDQAQDQLGHGVVQDLARSLAKSEGSCQLTTKQKKR